MHNVQLHWRRGLFKRLWKITYNIIWFHRSGCTQPSRLKIIMIGNYLIGCNTKMWTTERLIMQIVEVIRMSASEYPIEVSAHRCCFPSVVVSSNELCFQVKLRWKLIQKQQSDNHWKMLLRILFELQFLAHHQLRR